MPYDCFIDDAKKYKSLEACKQVLRLFFVHSHAASKVKGGGKMKAVLILENGMKFPGEAIGSFETTVGEVVFNTGMTGYQEIVTDPSYYGQIVVMTYPLIGNYGVLADIDQSDKPKINGFVAGEIHGEASNSKAIESLDAYLRKHGIFGIVGVDTRALVKVIGQYGTLKGIIALENLDEQTTQMMFEKFDISDAVYRVTTPVAYELPDAGKKVAIMDFGIKKGIIEQFKKRGCHLKIFPAHASAEDMIAFNPDIVFLSNGPGDPSQMSTIILEIKKMIGILPITGICLGHQLLALALDGKTERLKYGHRGSNHPVKTVSTGRITITSQNHGYHIAQLPSGVETTHVSMNDGTVEGMRHTLYPIYSVQFHPEGCPGPTDNHHLFDEFLDYAM